MEWMNMGGREGEEGGIYCPARMCWNFSKGLYAAQLQFELVRAITISVLFS